MRKSWIGNWILFVALGLAISCSNESRVRRAVNKVGPEILREKTIAVCREGFAHPVGVKIPDANWPEPVRAFKPLSLWAEPDGAYILIESDAGGERGVYLPRLMSDKDPICGPTLTHVKLANGVYWYDRKR